MAGDSKICRLCLKTLEKDLPYTVLNNDSALLDRLNVISFDTATNLELLEESLICDCCSDKVKDLSGFKQDVIANQFKIQCYTETELEAFLQTLSDNVDEICRLCLKVKENKRNFKDREGLLKECNIHMNSNIKTPSKLCKECDKLLQATIEFSSLCHKNEILISELASKSKRKLTCKDLIIGTTEQTEPLSEDDNRVRRTLRSGQGAKRKRELASTSNTIDKYFIKPVQEESFNITRSPNIYKNKKISPNKPSTSKTQSTLTNEKLISANIDALPITDLHDITLEVNEEGKVQEEAGNENNVTQELIDVLEGRLNDNVATQELLNVLEGKDDSEETNRDNNSILVTVEIAGKEPPKKPMNIIQVVTIKSKNDLKIADKNPEKNLDSEEPPEKKRTRGRPRKRVKKAPINDTSSDDDDDEFVENPNKMVDGKPVTVTIIKSKRRRNKAQLEKTWHELTGKPNNAPVGESSNNSTQESTTTTSTVPEALEIKLIRKRRGRPPLPPDQRKAARNNKKPKKTVLWMHCNLCSFKTYARNSFVQHQLIHNVMSSVSALSCDSCRFTTTDADVLAQHKSSHVDVNLTYKCIFCDEVFKKKTSCMYHTLRHDDRDVASQFYCMTYNGNTDEEYFECYQCNYQNVEESPMPDHVIDHTIEKPKNPMLAKFKCHQCPYRTKSEDRLKRHNEMHLAKNKKKKKKYNSASAIKKEEEEEEDDPDYLQLERNQDEDEEEELPVLNCDQCHYVTRNKRSLTNHKGLKHNRQAMPPDYTEAAAAAKLGNKQLYYCNECSYSTHRKLNMPRHALVHRTKDNMEFLECPHCLFETKHRRSYTRHMETSHGVIV